MKKLSFLFALIALLAFAPACHHHHHHHSGKGNSIQTGPMLNPNYHGKPGHGSFKPNHHGGPKPGFHVPKPGKR